MARLSLYVKGSFFTIPLDYPKSVVMITRQRLAYIGVRILGGIMKPSVPSIVA